VGFEQMALKPWLTQVGRFPVEHIGGIPLFEIKPVDLSAPRAGVAHTTEGSTIEGALAVFKVHYAPHFLLGKDSAGHVRVMQLVQIGVMGLALEAHNNLALVQVEIVGFSQEKPYSFDAETAEAVASLFASCHAEYGIPLSHPWPDGDYGRAGYKTAHRASGKFGRVAGWFAHADIPDNAHWDVGNLRWSELMVAAMAMEHAHAPPSPTPVPPPRPCAGGQASAPSPVCFNLTTADGLQRALKALGAQIEVTGAYGPATDKAISDFQRQAGLRPTGIVNMETRHAIMEELARV